MAYMDKPVQIFNLDKTEIPLDPKSSKAVTVRGVKHANTVSTGNKSQTTALWYCNYAGYVIPPLIIFKQRVIQNMHLRRWYSVWPI